MANDPLAVLITDREVILKVDILMKKAYQTQSRYKESSRESHTRGLGMQGSIKSSNRGQARPYNEYRSVRSRGEAETIRTPSICPYLEHFLETPATNYKNWRV
ncbi:conserved hypothetical protein [Ricinus communis]|uniref:Uncharacterized protein n=1 Tax=Ricinus communis TaxID=3988 RepID=B9SQG8_RICCO|nr:conserved hypothetical protein [Ricinus communis]